MLRIAHPAPQSRNLLGGVGKRIARLRFIESRDRGGSSDCAEGRARAFRAAMRLAHVVRAEREQKAAAEVVADRHGVKEFFAGATLALGQRERGGHHAAPRMRFRLRVEVVCLVGMAEHGVRERRVHGRRPDVGGEHARFSDTALAARILDGHLARLEMRTRHHRSDRIQDPVSGGLLHFGRELTLPRLDHVFRETSSDIGTRHSTSTVRRSGRGCGAERRRIAVRHSCRVSKLPSATGIRNGLGQQ